MDAKDLLAAYPRIVHAISFVEFFLCQTTEDDPESAWDFIVRQQMTPEQMVGVCKEECEETARERPEQEKHALARSEMDDPQFAVYIAGKLGAC